MRRIGKPKEGEYPPYAAVYIGLLPDDGLVLRHMRENLKATNAFMLSLPEERLAYRYAGGKWTVKEILAHVIDDERIYAYRALRFARNDPIELPGFDQDAYAPHSGANRRTVESLLGEFAAVRRATSPSSTASTAGRWRGRASPTVNARRCAPWPTTLPATSCVT